MFSIFETKRLGVNSSVHKISE